MAIISTIISLMIPIGLLYARKSKWLNLKLKGLIIIRMAIVSLVGFLFSSTNDYRIFFYALISTSIYLLMDAFLKKISFKIHNRDFYLWLRGSEEIDDSIFGMSKNKHVKSSDMFFSMALLILIVGITLFGAIPFGKDDLYGRWIRDFSIF